MTAGDTLKEEQAAQNARIAEALAEARRANERLDRLGSAPIPTPTDPPDGPTGEWDINLSHYRYTNHIVADPDSQTGYRCKPEFVAWGSGFRTLRMMNHTAQVSAKDRNTTWSNRISSSDEGTWDSVGLPIEALIETANACNADLWINLNQQSDVDFEFQKGRLFGGLLNPGLRVFYESANEASFDSNRAWRYRDAAGGDYAGTVQLYRDDFTSKARQFRQGFTDAGGDPSRVTRVIGGLLANPDIMKSHVLARLDDDDFDAITCSGYFGSSQHLGHDWAIGKHGLAESIARLQQHADMAMQRGKAIHLYEVNSHIINDLPLHQSEAVAQGVGQMLSAADDMGVGRKCIYSGAGRAYAAAPWPAYDTRYQPQGALVRTLGLPTVEAA